ncbi:MAG: TonB-dependent receptor [Ekhidna sp.]|nr:TonB-dependent receptor [Ekhidna sp.]
MRLIILVAVWAVLKGTLFGQTDTLSVHYLEEVVVEDKMYQAITGLDEVSIDPAILSNAEGSTFAELARRNGFQEFRAYGTSGLTLPSLRGTGSSHTALLWNGINLQSPLNGSADLSLLTINSTDQINIVKGGGTVQFGSGAIGGAIQVTDVSDYEKGLSILTSQEVGSFGNYYTKYGLQFSNERWALESAYFQRSLDNDYTYHNLHTFQQEKEVRENSALAQSGITGQLEYRLNEANVAGIRVWIQSNDYEIPSPVFSTAVISTQLDETNRYMAYWTLGKPDHSVSFKTAYLTHLTDYENETTSRASSSEFISWVNKLEYESYSKENIHLIFGANHRYDETNSNTHAGSPIRNTYSAYGSYFIAVSKFNLNLGARQEVYDDVLSPFLPTIGISYGVLPHIKIKGSASRNYRVPTFNDLYWSGAGGEGNPDLTAESSYNAEFGIIYDKPSKVKFRATVYRYDVDDWIQWRPNESSSWTPDNIKNVVSKGLDSRLELTIHQSSNLTLRSQLSHLWSVVTNKEVRELGNQKEIGKQLTYTPKHSGAAVLLIDSELANAVVTWNHVGEQFTEGENFKVRALAPYSVLNISLNRNIDIVNHEISLRCSMNNLLDKQYENRRGYPMYGRNFLIGITVKFNKQ